MPRKEDLREPAEYVPSRSTMMIVLGVVIVAISAFAYFTYRYVERHTVRQQPPVITPVPTPEPEASATATPSRKLTPQAPVDSTTPEPVEYVSPEPITVPEPPVSVQFRCDGRTRCSQMTSCAEAKFFLTHCPGTQMDGDNDGIPCEQQWCGN